MILTETSRTIGIALRRLGLKGLEGLDADEWRHGWRVVAGAAVGLGTGVSLYLMISSLFIAGLTGEYKWSRGDMGTAGAVAFVVGAVSLSIMGKIIDRIGFRPVVLVCAPAMAALYIMIALQPGSFALYLALMVWGGVFGAGTGAIAYTRPVVGVFARQRGLALGVATSGVSLTSIVLAPLLSETIEAHGWRAGLYALAVFTAAMGLPIALWLIASAERGHVSGHHVPAMTRDPAPHRDTNASAGDGTRGAAQLVHDVTVGTAMRMPAFWLIVAGLFCVNVPGAGVVGQLAPLITDKGLSAAATGYVMAVYAFGLLGGRLATGLALDHLPPALVAATMTAIPALGMTLLLVPSPSFELACIAVLMIGIQQGSEVDLIAYFVSRRFGLAYYGAIYGRVATFGAVGTALGLIAFGWVHDATGAYDWALVLGAAAFAAGAGAFAGLSRAK